MASKLIRFASHETQNQFEVSLRHSFELLEPNLRPPFSSKIPNPEKYSELNRAILYGVLWEPHFAKIHMKHLHAIVIDGYSLCVCLLLNVVNELYVKLVDSAKCQLLWITQEMLNVLAEGIDGLLVSLLRQIVGGDFSDGNLWLSFELVSLLMAKWDCLLEEEPLVLASALYTYLRLLSDHCRFSNNEKLEALKRLEIDFCVKVIKEQFQLCLKIGRDFIRLLQDLVHIPEFRKIWKDLLSNPSEFKTLGFSDISQLYRTRTSSRYIILRITPEMETQLRFLLTHIKLGSQKRHQVWFAKKFLCGLERETVIRDIVRFICCAHHPPNEVIQSDIIPRWAVIGWLLKSCRKHYMEANVKLALFFDWLFFDEKVDNIMNVEPAMLLMVYSIPKYIDITHNLLEFLLLLVDNYDVERKDIISRGVASAFSVLTKKGVIHSLDVLISFDGLSPILKERLGTLLSSTKVGVSREFQSPYLSSHTVTSFPLPDETCSKELASSAKEETINGQADEFCTKSSEGNAVAIENLLQNLREVIKKSNAIDLKILEELLVLYVNLDGNEQNSILMSPETLSSKIEKEYKLIGYKFFASLELLHNSSCYDEEIGSATALIIRTFILCQHEKLQEMLLFWSKRGFPVRARLLSYASRLAYEAHMADDSGAKLLLFHVDGYFSFLKSRKENFSATFVSNLQLDKSLTNDLVRSAFTAYNGFIVYSEDVLFGGAKTMSMPKILSDDVMCCFSWDEKKLTLLFHSIFCHLSNLCIGEVEIIRLIVSKLDHTDILSMQFEIGLKKFSIFGENAETILLLIKSSLNWDYLEQHKLWLLLKSELTVSNVRIEKIILQFFCSGELDASKHAIAVGGLFTLCSCRIPMPDLVGAVMLLPNYPFQDFSAAVLAAWSVSNDSMLFDSLATFAEKLSSKTADEIMINHSAILWILNYFRTQGINDSSIFTNLSVHIGGGKAVGQL